MKNLFRIKNLPDPISIREAALKNYVDNLFNDPSIVKSNAHIDLNDRNITDARFIQVYQGPQIDSHLTPKLNVDNAIDESSLVRNNHDSDFNNNKSTNTISNTVNIQAVNDNQVITKAYVVQFHQENERSRRDLGIDFYNESSYLVKKNQDNDLNANKLTNVNSITINNNPTDYNHVSNIKYIDDEIDKNTIVRFNQTLQNYLKVSVGSNIYNPTKDDEIQLTDTTIMKHPNSGGKFLQNWNIKCNDEINNGKIQNLKKKTRTKSPTGDSGASSYLLSVLLSYIQKQALVIMEIMFFFFSFGRIDIIQLTNIPFFYNRFSFLTKNKLKAVGRFRNQ